jgi:hypothetical protein
MGDDNEIRQLIRHDSESFLKSALDKSKNLINRYDFNAEFAKTKKNKSFVVIGATAITIAVLAVAAFMVTRAIEKQTAEAPMDVRAFEDLNLKDILDTSKRNEADLERIKLELSQLEYDNKAAILTADRNHQAAIDSIKANSASASDANAALAAETKGYEASKKNAQASYAARAAAKRAELAEVQKRVDQYDSRLVDQAKKQQAVLASQRVAFDLEKKKQADFYESRIKDLEAARARDVAQLKRQKDELADSLTSRYNPTFTDPRSGPLLSATAQGPTGEAPGFHPYLAEAGVLDKSDQARLDRSLSDFLYLSAKLRAVPYLNSVPPTLARLESEARSSIISYRSAIDVAGAGLSDRDKRIALLNARAEAAEKSLEQYRFAVSAYARAGRESGYILDARDGSAVLVYLDPSVSVVEGSVGYVSRGDKAIGSLIFHGSSGSPWASIGRLEAGEALKPFDSILVAARSEGASGGVAGDSTESTNGDTK